MASSNNIFSDTLQSITTTKLEELSKKRTLFEGQKAKVLRSFEAASADLDGLQVLLDGVKICFGAVSIPGKGKHRGTGTGRLVRGSTRNPRLEIKLRNLERFLEQARYDPSVSSELRESWKASLLEELDVQTQKYQYATLYGDLVTEWLTSEKRSTLPPGGDAEMTEAFEEVATSEKLESRVRWERSVFEPLETDRKAIDDYLNTLFGKADNTQAFKALKELRRNVKAFEINIRGTQPFSLASLPWIINGLLASDLLSDEKRHVLKDFQSNQTILSEVADVLNMRMAALDSWTWGEAVPVEQRKRITGTYNIYMHEDLLQAVFLQFIGVKWGVLFKSVFKAFYKFDGAWAPLSTPMSKLDKKRREYFLGPQSKKHSVQSKRENLYQAGYFMSTLPDSEFQEVVVDEGDEEADFEPPMKRKRTMQTARSSVQQPAQRMQMASMAARRAPASSASFAAQPSGEDDEDEDDEEWPGSGQRKNPMELKQARLHLLATEILVNIRLHGELTCVRAEFEAWYPLLPHSTIYAVLAFFGVSDKWLSFFRRFLEAPLKFLQDGENGEARIRKRGVPGSHSLSNVLAEILLFCLDFAINQSTGGAQLHRIYDDFWLWSADHKTCVKAWTATTKFSSVMGVTLNEAKAGTVRIVRQKGSGSAKLDSSLPQGPIRWGFLFLDPESGHFKIDQSMVDSHIRELQRQLNGKTKSIVQWVQAWNTYAGTFFSANFGKPAKCFGQEHVDMMLATFERVQRTVFSTDGTGSVVESLQGAIHQRFDLSDIPDGYFYFPTELGGLEVNNPFIGLLQIRDMVPEDPSALLDEFEEAEKDAYRKAKIAFEKGEIEHYTLDDPNFVPKDKDIFMSFEEFARYREDLNYGYDNELRKVYLKLLERPGLESIEATAEVISGLSCLNLTTTVTTSGIQNSWYSMDNYWKWVTQLYGPELMKKFGGLNIVDAGLLPIGMVSEFRSGRVKWQG